MIMMTVTSAQRSDYILRGVSVIQVNPFRILKRMINLHDMAIIEPLTVRLSIPSPSIVLRLPSAPASSSSRRSHHHHHQLRRTSSTSSTSTTTATTTSTKNHKLLEVNFLRHDFIPVQIIATTFHNRLLTQP